MLNLFGDVTVREAHSAEATRGRVAHSLGVESRRGGRLAGFPPELRIGHFIPTATLLQVHCRAPPEDKLTIEKGVTTGETL